MDEKTRNRIWDLLPPVEQVQRHGPLTEAETASCQNDMQAQVLRIVASAPKLSDEQREKLGCLLGSFGPSDLHAVRTLRDKGISVSLHGPAIDKPVSIPPDVAWQDAAAHIWVE